MSYKSMMRNIGLGAFGLALCALSEASPSISVGSSQAFPGYYETIPISFWTDVPVSGLQFDLVYDPVNVVVGSSSLPAASLPNHFVSVKPTAGRIKIAVVPSSTENKDIPLGTLMTFQITFCHQSLSCSSNSTAASAQLSVENVVYGNVIASEVAGNWANGLLTRKTDFDGDGIPDDQDPDDDNDGMSDWYETKYGLNPNYAGDAGLDLDGDGLTNLQEYQKNSNPNLADTDGDGLRDDVDPHPAIAENLIPAIITIINSLILD